MKHKISLVLGSGGARGLAHIGVIKWLTAKGYEIDEIVGCSIGSLVGAAFAEGRINELSHWMSNLTKREVFRLMDFTDPRFGILKGERVFHTLQDVFEDMAIEDLKIKYTAVATDLVEGKEVIFREGSIYAAIRASIAIPAVFRGVEQKGRFLVDGGVLNPIPINYVQETNTITVVVNLDGAPNGDNETHYAKLNALGILQESYIAMRRRLSNMSLALYKPDYVVDVPHNMAGIWDFDRASELIENGYELAEKQLVSLLA